MAFTVNKEAFCVLEFAKTESIVTVRRRFRIMYHTEPPTDKTIREWYMKFQQSGCLCAAKRTGCPDPWAWKSRRDLWITLYTSEQQQIEQNEPYNWETLWNHYISSYIFCPSFSCFEDQDLTTKPFSVVTTLIFLWTSNETSLDSISLEDLFSNCVLCFPSPSPALSWNTIRLFVLTCRGINLERNMTHSTEQCVNICQEIVWNNQQMQLYAVNFIPLLGSLYMFRVCKTPETCRVNLALE